jgi:glycosyltransferase involved in cell wall biosynthesis
VSVLLVADVVGGVRTFVDELTCALSRCGVDVHLALLGQDEPEPAARAAATCEVRDLKLEWMDDPWRDVVATGEWIEELVVRHRPDVIHMNTFAPVPGIELPVLLTVHSCVLSWWRAVHGVDAPDDWARYWWLARRALDRADVLCAPTRALLEELAAVYGRLPRARVIPNGRAIEPPSGFRRERLVLSVGRVWDEAKNAGLLARAARAIDARVATIGSGRVDGLESLGSLPPQEVIRWLARAAVFAEPARYEPFGLAALEAAQCGCALVLGDIPSLREVWDDAATFVSPDDPEELAHTINQLLDDPARGRRAANLARARAARYAPRAMADAYLNAYRTLRRTALPA